jgi:hypothetical protein
VKLTHEQASASSSALSAHGSLQRLVARGAAVLIIVHLVDSILVEPDWSLAFVGAIALGAMTTALSAADGAIPLRPRSAAFLILSFVWVMGGLYHHVVPTLLRGAQATDVSGVASTIAAVALIATSLQHLTSDRSRSKVAEIQRSAHEPGAVK